MTAVISLDTQTFLGHNQETYQDLRLALQLNLRRQLLLAVCDDVDLQHQLAQRLEADLSPYGAGQIGALPKRGEFSPIVTLRFDAENPDLVRQVLLWLKQHRLLKASAQTIPAFQIVGLEQLTRRSPTLQNKFLAALINVDALITRLDCRLLIWIPRPWLGKIQQAVPGFWRSRSGLFEFAGDPTPTHKGPISFEVRPPDQARPAGQRPPAAPLKLPDLDIAGVPPSAHGESPPASASGQTENLWTMLREDLSAFENPLDPPEQPQSGTVLPRATGPVAKPQPPAPSHADSQTKPSSGAVIPASAFKVVTNNPLTTVVMPPSRENQTAPGPTPAESRAEENLKTSYPSDLKPPGSPMQTSQSKPVQNPSGGQPADSLTGLPDELTQDQEVVHLWQYIQSLEAQQAGPLTLSRAYLGLGQMSRDRIEADVTNQSLLDFAIEAYRKAIPGLLEGDENWCDALNDLASLYWLRSQREEAPNTVVAWLKQSINAYQKALQGSQTTASAETLLRLWSNLGTAYSLLANLTEPLINLQQSRQAYEQAMQYAPVDILPEEYANLQNGLGAVYWRMAQLDQPQYHLHQAIAAYAEALPYYNPQVAALDYAMIQNNLGIAYWSLAHHETANLLLKKAIDAYQAALQYRTLTTTPAGCAATHNNLGTAYWDLAQQHSRDPEQRMVCLQQSVTAYENALNAAEVALQATPPPPLGFDVCATFHSAGVVHDQLAQGLPVDQHQQRKRHLQQALQHYLLAYQGWQDNPDQLEVLVAALVYNIRLSFDILGLAGQQAVLSQVPGELLPQILGQL